MEINVLMGTHKKNGFIKSTKPQGSLPGVDMSKVYESRPRIVKEGQEYLLIEPKPKKKH